MFVCGFWGFFFFLLLQGCFSVVTTAMESNLGIIAGISFGIAFFQVKASLFCLVFIVIHPDTCALTEYLDNERQKRRAAVHKRVASRFLRSLVKLTLIELVEPA